MKKLASVILTVCLTLGMTSCSLNLLPGESASATVKPSTAKELVTKLKMAKLPIGKIIVYTEKTDTNNLLGRPNQYISKVSFADKGVVQYLPNDPEGGTIETFNNSEDLTDRVTYIKTIEKSMPVFTEYIVINGNYLLRLNKKLTSKQVAKYKKVFMSLK